MLKCQRSESVVSKSGSGNANMKVSILQSNFIHLHIHIGSVGISEDAVPLLRRKNKHFTEAEKHGCRINPGGVLLLQDQSPAANQLHPD